MEPQNNRLLTRIAEAIEHYGVFIFQQELDDPNSILALLRQAGVSILVDIKKLSHSIYVVLPNEKPCHTTCRYDKCSTVEENKQEECIRECLAECIKELKTKLVEVLRTHARRF